MLVASPQEEYMANSKRRYAFFLVFFLLLVSLLMTSCLPGIYSLGKQKPAGFLLGIWHGWIAPISLIIGIFKPEVRIYDSFNTGWWYDFGYYMAIISGFGGLSLARKKSNRGRNDRKY
jgi:hypothetical protein